MSVISQFQGLWKMFIRPARQEYSKGDLGHETRIFGKYKSKRTDCVILNKKSQKLQCSLFEPISLDNDNHQSTFPCVIYCHCSSGSRLEALRILPQIIQSGIGLFCFDFSGSGLSEGEYITLGINESHDLECVVNYLVSLGKVSNIALWGRSMGAVTCILYMGMNTKHNAVKAIVFDSGFSNMNQLSLDLAKQKTGMPNMLIEPALYLVKDQVRERVNVDIQSIDLAKTIHSIYVPIHFVCSKEDTFVKSDHSERLYERYNGLKWIEYTNGGHNAHRPNELIDMLVDWTSYFVFDRKKPAFYQYIPKTTVSGQGKELEDNSQQQQYGESIVQNRRQSRISNSITVNRGIQQTPESIQEQLKNLNDNLAKTKQPCIDMPVSPIKNIILLGRQPNNSNQACSPTAQIQSQAGQVRISQEMSSSIIGQNTFIFPSKYGKEGQQQYEDQQVDQPLLGQQQRGRNAKILFEEKESLQLQSQDSVSSQTRLGTEETSSRNENVDSQINMLSSRNASNNRSSNHNGYASNSINNLHADSFLSSTNEELNSNECPSAATPQRMHGQINMPNYEFEDSPQIGKNHKNNSKSVIALTPQSSNDQYQRLSSNFNSFQGAGNIINNTFGQGQVVSPLAGQKSSFIQASNFVQEEKQSHEYTQEPLDLAARGQGTPQFNKETKSHYQLIEGGTPSSSGSFKSDFQDSPNLPHNFPTSYAKNEPQQNRHYSSSNICANLNARNHRNLSQFSIPKEISHNNNNTNLNQPNDSNTFKPSDSILDNKNPQTIPQYSQVSSSQPQLFQGGFKNINKPDNQRQSYQLYSDQQLITNHQPFKTPAQSTLGSSNRYQQIGDNNVPSSYRQSRSATCNGLIQFPGLSQGNIHENNGSNIVAADSKNIVNIEPSPYIPFFMQSGLNTTKNNTSIPQNQTPLQDTVRLRGLNTSIDFNILSASSQAAGGAQNTPKSLKVLNPSLKHAQTHLSFPSMPQSQASNNQSISFPSSSNYNYQHTNQYLPQTKEQLPPPVKVISLCHESQKQSQQQPVNNLDVTNGRGILNNPLSQSFDRQKQPTPVVGINICSPKGGAVSKTPEQSLYFASQQNNSSNQLKKVQFSNIQSVPAQNNSSNLVDKSLPSMSEVLQQRQILNNSNKDNVNMTDCRQLKENNNLSNEKFTTQTSLKNQSSLFSMPLQFFNTFDNSRDLYGGNGSFVQQQQQTQQTVAQTTCSFNDFSTQLRNKQFK